MKLKSMFHALLLIQSALINKGRAQSADEFLTILRAKDDSMQGVLLTYQTTVLLVHEGIDDEAETESTVMEAVYNSSMVANGNNVVLERRLASEHAGDITPLPYQKWTLIDFDVREKIGEIDVIIDIYPKPPVFRPLLSVSVWKWNSFMGTVWARGSRILHLFYPRQKAGTLKVFLRLDLHPKTCGSEPPSAVIPSL
jgi:hypothetical protein